MMFPSKRIEETITFLPKRLHKGHYNFIDFDKIELTGFRPLRSSPDEKEKQHFDPSQFRQSPNLMNKSVEYFGEEEKELKILQKTNHRAEHIRNGIIGSHATFQGPFGPRTCVYLDTTASGKSLVIIEDFIRHHVLPYYANTHTTISMTAAITTNYRDEARQIIEEAVGATVDDVVLFCGQGSTTAIHKLVHSLGTLKDAIVFVGPYEHHSNLLPWRESGARVMNLPDDATGSVDLLVLEKNLIKFSKKSSTAGRRILVSLSAGSNVTGAVVDDIRVTRLVHKYGGLCFWDYSAAAPHVKIHMNPSVSTDDSSKDAIFFSGHKFLGGPQTTGILVAKRHLFRNPVPHGAGGGTIFFVTPENHSYLEKLEESQEGGTPGIVQSIRLGLVFHFQELISHKLLLARESTFTKRALRAWSSVPNLVVLGNLTSPRLPIITFVIEHPQSGYFLHHNFVVAVLNDLFGIQCRGGCMCAGPYGQLLLGIDHQLTQRYIKALSTDCGPRGDKGSNGKKSTATYHMIYRPGYTRISLPFECSSEEVDFVIEAVKMVAKFGWRLLPQYTVSMETGLFQHASINNNNNNHKMATLRDLQFYPNNKQQQKKLQLNGHDNLDVEKLAICLNKIVLDNYHLLNDVNASKTRTETKQGLLDEAVKILNLAGVQNYKDDQTLNDGQSDQNFGVDERLRWFMLPRDAVACLNQDRDNEEPFKIIDSPFKIDVGRYELDDERTVSAIPFLPKSIPYQLQNTSD